MNKAKAEIKWIINDNNKEGLVMLIDGNYDTAWAIEESEIGAIKDACEVYLEEESQRVMKGQDEH